MPFAELSVTVLENNIKNSKYFTKIRPVGIALFLAHTEMYRRTEVTRLKVAFRRIFFQRGHKPCKEVTDINVVILTFVTSVNYVVIILPLPNDHTLQMINIPRSI